MVGGAEHSVKILAEALVQRGHQVLVISCDGYDFQQCEEINGVQIQRLRYQWFNMHDFGGGGTFLRKVEIHKKEALNHAAKDAVASIVEAYRPAVFHSNNLYGLSPLVWESAASVGVPVVHTLRDYQLLDPLAVIGKSPAFVSHAWKKITRLYSNKYVSCVTAPSLTTLSRHISEGLFENSSLQEVVPNCVDVDGETLELELARRQAIETGDVTFLFVGSLVEHKGIGQLLDAFSYIQNPQVHLCIAGGGKLEGLVRERSCGDPRISYLGQLDDQGMEAAYRNADVLVAPSVWEEPFGRVVIEAFAHGLPVIGADRGGIAEIINATGCGVLVNSNSVDDICEKLNYFADRRKVKSILPRLNRSLESYTVEAQVKQFEIIYNRVLVDRRKRSSDER